MNFLAAATPSGVFSGETPAVTANMLNGVLDEILNGLPVVLPVCIAFLAIRKGISFVIGMLRSA
jgi:hypothetical protein